MTVGTYGHTLGRKGFQAFLWTQFLGALNDNICKIVVSMLAVGLAGSSSGSGQLPEVGLVFILPFLLFSGYAGQVADRFNKRTVLVVTKALEIVAMVLGIFAFGAGRLDWMLAVLFLLALQATFFSPAKYGIVPEILPDRELSRANGLLEMSTFAAIVLGTSVGSFMFAAWRDHLAAIAIALTLIAIVGTAASFGIPNGAGPRGATSIRLNPWAGLGAGLGRLRRDRTLGLAVLGISYFWFLGALLQMVILLFGKEAMRLDDVWIGLLGTFLAVGIGVGSMAAGRLSGDKVELGLVPLGSIGMGVFAILLSQSGGSFAAASVCLALLGFSGGLFIVPLNALLQQRPEAGVKGQMIATNNLLNTLGIMVASGALWLLRDTWQIPTERIIFVTGLFTFAANVYVLSLLPDYLVRFVLWLLVHTVYRIRIVGHEHVPFRGPALLVCNHISHIDGFLVGASVQRFVRFMVYRPYYEMRLLNPVLRLMNAIPTAGGTREQAVESIERAREELRAGHVVCIFAEGAISRTGNLLPFKRGVERIVEGLDVPVIPVYLDRLWGSVFSFKQGRFFWKWPERIPYPVTVTFGPPLASRGLEAHDARQAILELSAVAIGRRFESDDRLHSRFIATAKRHWRSFAMADSTGKQLTYGEALTASLLLSQWVRGHVAGEMVGIMLPSSVGGALVNLGVTMAGRIPVNINFTVGREAMASVTAQCGIEAIITSRVFLAKAKLEETAGMIFVEDALKSMTTSQKARTGLLARLVPRRLLERWYAPESIGVDDLATVIFSSGSTGQPKGVMLSHRNVLAVTEGLAQMFWVTPKDRMMGVLPFFHSFGFSGGLWLPLVCGFGVVYHTNPMDAGVVGELVGSHGATLLISTPTFCAAYVRKCTPAQFRTLRVAVAGAEKLRDPVARAFKEKYGLDLLEGYGCTEMAPVISVNVPDVAQARQKGTKAGTVGHPLPGVVTKVVHPETGEPAPPGAEGLLLVKGANLMTGYLNNPEATSQVLRGDWYVTGDIVSIDEDGFITIRDRLSRFSKIGGEMVPHLKIEEVMSTVLDDDACVVTAVPDEAKGEKVMAFYVRQDLKPGDVWERLSASDLPKLWIPKKENIHQVDDIPLLGTGKVDLQRMKALALERSAARA